MGGGGAPRQPRPTLLGEVKYLPQKPGAPFTKAKRYMLSVKDALLMTSLWGRYPWAWLCDCVETIDEADEGMAKPIPRLAYMRYVVERWQRSRGRILAVPKSRRMMMTWLMLAVHLHLALFTERVAVFVQSKKREDSEYLLGESRMLYMYRHLPEVVEWPSVRTKDGALLFSNGSQVIPVGQGSEQLRQYTATAILCDEVRSWDQAEDTWTSLRPTIQGGGRITLVSSAGPGFFARVVEGRLRDDTKRQG